MTFKQFTKYCCALWFYSVIKTMGKRKEENDTFLRKKTEEKKQCFHNDLCKRKMEVFPVKLKLEKESFE